MTIISRKHYISLLVHYDLISIINLLLNFKKYYKEATIVIHISPSSNFSKQNLLDSINYNKIDNVIINPKSCNTEWANIIKAHFLNIELIKQLGDASHISFHSSNELFIKKGVYKYITNNNINNLFNTRVITPNTNWWPGKAALNDPHLLQVISHVNPLGKVMGGQIEGSMYSSDLMFEILAVANKFDFINSKADTLYPREELLFTSLATSMNIIPDGLPYVFSEVQRADKKIFFIIDLLSKLKLVDKNDKDIFCNKIIKLFNNHIIKQSRISINDIRLLLLDKHPIKILYLNDKAVNTPMFDTKHIYGIKRIPRKITNKIVQYINNLS